MRQKTFITLLLAITFILLSLSAIQDKPSPKVINGFTVLKITDKTARIKVKDGKYTKISEGSHYPFPSIIRSNKSQVFIKFSEQNTARLLPKTILKLSSEKVKHPKLKLLDGKVALELDRFPKDHKIEVSTPTAVCGAIGTRFEVSYSEQNDKDSMNQTFKCTKGEVFVNSETFKIKGVKQGQEIKTQTYSGLSNSYCKVNLEGNNTFKISLPDDSQYTAKSTSFEIAKPLSGDIAIIKTSDKNLKTLGFFEEVSTPIQPGTSYVKVGDSYVRHADTESYLAAVKNEGVLDAKVKELDLKLEFIDDENEQSLTEQKESLIKERKLAADKASKIFKRIRQDNQIRSVIQKVRQNINRQQIRRVR
ncbi:MAG: FecR family protein [Lentisphaeraceae bacterium]|nr:FecR family protein [Lentisphaeraceae bacterium]